MSTSFHITGAISSFFFLLSLVGLYSQIQKMKDIEASGKELRSSAVLSLNQFTVAFLAYFGFFIYGGSLRPINHYLMWPRLGAILLVLIILWKIYNDRRDFTSCISFFTLVGVFIFGVSFLTLSPSVEPVGRASSQLLIIVVSVLLAQGYAHQIWRIRLAGSTGAISWQMHLLTLLKDLSMLAFALTMPWSDGWPLYLLAAVSGVTKVIILWHFGWAERSDLAKKRRRIFEKSRRV
ncbi:MAG: hypothetical protein KDD55_07610 [Bdellovibrionales bacterium]|nr:hypothetical protein [Bdellovibrionales bacterium]